MRKIYLAIMIIISFLSVFIIIYSYQSHHADKHLYDDDLSDVPAAKIVVHNYDGPANPYEETPSSQNNESKNKEQKYSEKNQTDANMPNNPSEASLTVSRNIRVALKTTDYTDHYHKSVTVSSDLGMRVVSNDGEQLYSAGEEVCFDMQNNLLKSGKILIQPANGGRLLIKSIVRNKENRYYRGTLELSAKKEGILIINELSVDEYLYSVIPSEMPVSYGMEALKAQAVCARSYAYMKMKSGGLYGINADVDDSTSCQVYNSYSECNESIQAVSETSGLVLTHKGKVISAYYFSTSCGSTASGNDVWLGMKKTPYLKAETQYIDANEKSANCSSAELSDDTAFKEFIDNHKAETYDSSFPWYRWKISMSGENIKASFNKYVPQRIKVNPSFILVKENGVFVKKNPGDLGDIKDIKIVKRSEGGISTEMIIKGTKETVKVVSEYNIRAVLAPINSAIERMDGSVVEGFKLLPSAFFYVEKKDGNFILHGGGYGHGVGMSQNGAHKMSELGYSFADILKHYFNGCEVVGASAQQ